MKSAAESGGWSCNWGIDFSKVSRRGFLKGSAATASLAALLPSCSGEKEQGKKEAATVFTGGTVLTVDEKFSEAQAVAIRGNRILAVGSDEEVRKAAGEGAEVVDLKGKTVLPGFVDPHSHVVAGSVVDSIMEYVGMARFQTTDEVLSHLKKRAGEIPAGEWLALVSTPSTTFSSSFLGGLSIGRARCLWQRGRQSR